MPASGSILDTLLQNYDTAGLAVALVGAGGILAPKGVPLIIAAIMGQFQEKSISEVKRVLLGFLGIVFLLPTLAVAYGFTILLIIPASNESGTKSGEYVAPPDEQGGNSGNYFFGSPGKFVDCRAGMLRNFERHGRPQLTTLLIDAEYPPTSSNLQLAQTDNWELVESFQLDQRNIRRLKYSRFQGEVHVYVGDIRKVIAPVWPPEVYIVICKERNEANENICLPESGYISKSDFLQKINSVRKEKKHLLSVQKGGDYIDFQFPQDSEQTYRLTVTEIYAVLLGTDKIAVEISMGVADESTPQPKKKL